MNFSRELKRKYFFYFLFFFFSSDSAELSLDFIACCRRSHIAASYNTNHEQRKKFFPRPERRGIKYNLSQLNSIKINLGWNEGTCINGPGDRQGTLYSLMNFSFLLWCSHFAWMRLCVWFSGIRYLSFIVYYGHSHTEHNARLYYISYEIEIIRWSVRTRATRMPSYLLLHNTFSMEEHKDISPQTSHSPSNERNK